MMSPIMKVDNAEACPYRIKTTNNALKTQA